MSLDNLGSCYKDNSYRWYPLDNSAKIYPLAIKENWMNVYRLSYYLKEDVNPYILQIALTFTMKRFPTFTTTIRRGFFWHYIDGIKKRFQVYEDKRLPCSYINVSNTRKQSFKAVYYKNRISVEYFHVLTDGHGAVCFISTLVSTYLRLMGKKIDTNDIVLNVEEEPKKEEILDEFVNIKVKSKSNSLMESKAVQLDGKLSNIKPSQIIHFDIPLNDLKKSSNERNSTITEMIVTLLFLILNQSTSKEGNIKIQIPINMRKYYNSKSLRNFSLYAIISINKKDITDYDSVLNEVKKQLKEKNNINYLNGLMVYSRKLVNSIKFMPLFIKKPIASIIYGFAGDKSTTTVLSNLGVINIPDNMKNNIEKMDFVLGTALTNRILFSLITVNDIVTLSITKYTTNASVENLLYKTLIDMNIDIKVHGSENYENRK